jgi:hypothetical protein
MKANKYISKKEHILLILVALLFFTFVSSVLILDIIHSYNHSVLEEQRTLKGLTNGEPIIRFSGNRAPDLLMPGIHILSLVLFVVVFKSSRFFASLFLTLFYAAFFIYGLAARYDGSLLGGVEFSPQVSFAEKLYREFYPFDYLAAFFISILFLWQVSIVFRIFRKFVQGKNQLT